jgi:UDP-N-acetylmuramate--alanine ligase
MSRIFFSGIGGSGMSAIAGFAADHGHSVAGSDRSFDKDPDNPICKILRNKGIHIVPQDGLGIDKSFDFAVCSTAVESDQAEVVKAGELGIPVKTRPQYLSELVAQFSTVAVAGTSGKSTTAGMLAFLMERLGREPNFIGGGRVKQFRSRGNLGNSLSGNSDLLVVEACESDGSIVHYFPSYSIISNLGLDHHSITETASMFEALGRNTKRIVVMSGDDENLNLCRFDDPIRFSIETDSKYQAKSIEYQAFGSSFQLCGTAFRLSLPGEYNLYNALSCIALLSEMGIALRDVAEVLPSFAGIERRFDVHLNNERYLVVDDYAHNPHKIASLMGAIKRIREKICYIFQPHGYGPTRLMKREYIAAFSANLRKEDHLILLPIYFAGGTSIKDISSEDLCDGIKAAGGSAEVLPERALLFGRLKEWDNYVVFGARDESLAGFAREIALRLR